MFFRVALFLIAVCGLHAATAEQPQPLHRLIFADSEAAAKAIRPTSEDTRTVIVQGLPLLAQPDFSPTMAPFMGQQITVALLNKIADAISAYAKAHDRLIANVLVPNQVVGDGNVRLVVVFGHFSDVIIKSNHWFSSQLIQDRLGIKPGDEVRLSVLEEAVNWANSNPFRRIKVFVNPIASQPGKADLIVGVQEVAPWRVWGSVDNYGTTVLGQWHYGVGMQAGNLWGRDHIASYQFSTTDDIHLYQAHALNYRMPLPWRHFLEATVTYVRVNAQLNQFFNQTGRNEGASLKYTIPVRNGDDPIEIHGGFDFKRGNNNLEFAGFSVFPTNVDTYQFSAGGSWFRHDKLGGTAVVANVAASPGYVDAKNNRSTYDSARSGSNPTYVYGNVVIQRSFNFPKDWNLTNRLTSQIASTNLQGGEQLAAGGALSVRGFNTNIYAGDAGFIFNNDLQTPAITKSLESISKKLQPLETRFAAFYDAAQFWQHHRIGTDPIMRPLASAGLGLRMNVGSNFSLNFDYGWQISRANQRYYPDQSHGHGHVKVSLAF